jgi:hypothetical protein
MSAPKALDLTIYRERETPDMALAHCVLKYGSKQDSKAKANDYAQFKA